MYEWKFVSFYIFIMYNSFLKAKGTWLLAKYHGLSYLLLMQLVSNVLMGMGIILLIKYIISCKANFTSLIF